ncbi:hypothetical protein JTB14_018864 [Gonioctena quinquepunctata]|nr:hypothetical protein JTB14_018864 [Gonioctena quinquepunctata]
MANETLTEDLILDNNLLTDEEERDSEDADPDLNNDFTYTIHIADNGCVVVMLPRILDRCVLMFRNISQVEEHCGETEKRATVTNRKWKKVASEERMPEFNFPEGPVETEVIDCNSAIDVYLRLLGESVDDIVFQSYLHDVMPCIYRGIIYFDAGNKYPKIIFDGCDYSIHKKSKNHTSWRCSSYYRYKCRAKLITSGRSLTIDGTHHHERSDKVISRIKGMTSHVVDIRRLP